MNSKPFSRKNVLSLILVAFVSIALIAWGGHQPAHTQTTNQNFTDTVPKNKTDKKIRDLDDAIDQLDKAEFQLNMDKVKAQVQEALKQVDMAKIQIEIDKAMKDVDMSKIKAEMDKAMKEVDMSKIKAEIDRAAKEIDVAKIQRDIKESMAKVDWEKIKRDMEEVKKVDMSKLNEDMKKLELEMKDLGPKIEKQMEKAKVEMEKAKQEMKEYKSFVDGLDKEGLINKKEGYSIQHKDGELIINGKKQPADVYNKYRSFLEKHEKFNIRKSDDDFNLNNNDDH